MKNLLTSLLILTIATNVAAQESKPWNVGLNFSTSFNSNILFAPSLNRDIGARFEAGLILVYNSQKWDSYYSGTVRESVVGYNISAKYFISKENKMDPYAFFVAGYGTTTRKDANGESSSDYVDIALLLGNELQLGKSTWYFDFNVGLLWSRPINYEQEFQLIPMYTFGFKKRFRDKRDKRDK